jgi:hypothetical protein
VAVSAVVVGSGVDEGEVTDEEVTVFVDDEPTDVLRDSS